MDLDNVDSKSGPLRQSIQKLSGSPEDGDLIKYVNDESTKTLQGKHGLYRNMQLQQYYRCSTYGVIVPNYSKYSVVYVPMSIYRTLVRDLTSTLDIDVDNGIYALFIRFPTIDYKHCQYMNIKPTEDHNSQTSIAFPPRQTGVYHADFDGDAGFIYVIKDRLAYAEATSFKYTNSTDTAPVRGPLGPSIPTANNYDLQHGVHSTDQSDTYSSDTLRYIYTTLSHQQCIDRPDMDITRSHLRTGLKTNSVTSYYDAVAVDRVDRSDDPVDMSIVDRYMDARDEHRMVEVYKQSSKAEIGALSRHGRCESMCYWMSETGGCFYNICGISTYIGHIKVSRNDCEGNPFVRAVSVVTGSLMSVTLKTKAIDSKLSSACETFIAGSNSDNVSIAVRNNVDQSLVTIRCNIDDLSDYQIYGAVDQRVLRYISTYHPSRLRSVIDIGTRMIAYETKHSMTSIELDALGLMMLTICIWGKVALVDETHSSLYYAPCTHFYIYHQKADAAESLCGTVLDGDSIPGVFYLAPIDTSLSNSIGIR